MTGQVLTDQELTQTYLGGSSDMLKCLRAVEAAVLAKLPSPRWGGVVVGVTERKAQLRERTAAFAALHAFVSDFKWCMTRSETEAWVNARYPLPACDKCGQVLP